MLPVQHPAMHAHNVHHHQQSLLHQHHQHSFAMMHHHHHAPAAHHHMLPPGLPGVEAILQNKEMWQEFHDTGTEMIITKSGR